MFETFLSLYDVLWLECTTLLFIGAPLMSLFGHEVLISVHTSWPIYGDHYTVDWDGVFSFSVISGQSVCNACVNLANDGQSRRQLVS